MNGFQQENDAQQLWKVCDTNGNVYGTLDRAAALEMADQVERENPDIESVGICVAEMQPVRAPGWFSKPLEEE